jgi:hypothetical protein
MCQRRWCAIRRALLSQPGTVCLSQEVSRHMLLFVRHAHTVYAGMCWCCNSTKPISSQQ